MHKVDFTKKPKKDLDLIAKLLEMSRSGGITLYQVSKAGNLKLAEANRYMCELFNSKLVDEKDNRLVVNSKGLRYLDIYRELKA